MSGAIKVCAKKIVVNCEESTGRQNVIEFKMSYHNRFITINDWGIKFFCEIGSIMLMFPVACVKDQDGSYHSIREF